MPVDAERGKLGSVEWSITRSELPSETISVPIEYSFPLDTVTGADEGTETIKPVALDALKVTISLSIVTVKS